MSYLKPQTPIELGGNYIYPLTTADQVIVGNGNRLDSLFKKTIQETVILKASNWSESAPYTQTITLTESVDDYKVDANVMYTGNENDSALNKAAGCLSYIKKNRKEITFYCLKNKPEIDIPVEITGTCRNTIATVENGIKLNFDIVAYGSEEEMLADSPAENTIGVITDTPITGYRLNGNEPKNMNNGEVWIAIDAIGSNSKFEIIEGVQISPIYAKQMVYGALVDVKAKSWLNGTWVDWLTDRILYDAGIHYVQFEKNTGASTAVEDNGQLGFDTYYPGEFFWVSSETVNVSGFSKLAANVTRNAGNANALWIGLVKNKLDAVPDASIDFSGSVAYEGWSSTEILQLSGDYYVKIYYKAVSGDGVAFRTRTITLEV